MANGHKTCGLHPSHVRNRCKLPVRKRHARPCDICGTLTKAASGRCDRCQRTHGHLCSVCGSPASSSMHSRCAIHRIRHFCPLCGQETRGVCDACDACAVEAGWMVYRYRGIQGRVPENAPCAVCGARAVDTHHLSYKPQVLVYLCRSCHRKVHGRSLPTGRTSRVRTDLGSGKRISHRRTSGDRKELRQHGSES